MCQNCGENEANVRYTQIINGVKKQINVCDKCARKLGIGSLSFNMPIHFSDFLGDFFDDYDTDLLPSFVKETNSLCKNCGETYDDFIKTGLLGCPEDYEIFESRLDPILKKLQGNNRHVGRRSNNYSSKVDEINKEIIGDKNSIKTNKTKSEVSNEEKLEKLQDDLKVAIKEERYEDAAKIRDEINKLKK